MSDLTLQLQGKPVTKLELHVPAGGVWFADCSLPDAVVLSGRVTLSIGDAKFLGTIDPEFSGLFAGSAFYRVVAGGGGWGKPVPRKPYANDAGVKALTVARDVAAEVGEALGAFEPSRVKFDVSYARRSCLASEVLEDAAGSAAWWVGFDGLTNVGPRAQSVPDGKLHHVVDWDPIGQMATIAIEDPSVIQIGSALTDAERFSGTQLVREFVLKAEGSSIQVEAWCGTTMATEARLPGLLRKFVEHVIDPRLSVKWRYRVESMVSDGRANLLAMNKSAPFPSLQRVAQIPGVASAYSEITKGAIVLVEFVEGDPSMPMMSPGSDTRDPNFVAERVTLGGKTGADAAVKGNSVHVLFPPMIFSGTVGGVTAAGVMVAPMGFTLGTIETGSSKVGIAP